MRKVTAFVAYCILTVPLQAQPFHFTVTCDMRNFHNEFGDVLDAMNQHTGGQGVFQISPGDVDDRVWDNRTKIDEKMGTDALWYICAGNHETEDSVEMAWIRDEYQTGNDGRPPFKNFTNQDGPTGTVETTFSWDYGNAHFVNLNQYWNGGVASGSDVATDGDIVPELLAWLAADLASNTRPVVFIVGHEPAFPFNRHVGDSLDQNPSRRDMFWNLLESENVAAYLCGHTHYYSKYRRPGGQVWQVDAGNAGNDPGDGKTFVDVIVSDVDVRFDVWRGSSDNFNMSDSWTIDITAEETVRIMLLGDSITESDTNHDSYRRPLWQMLMNNGYINVDFVGSKHASPPHPDFDLDHEGHWAWQAGHILNGDFPDNDPSNNIHLWAPVYRPDIVLMHLGTNDVFNQQSTASTIDELDQIVDVLRDANPEVAVLAAQLIPPGGQGTIDLNAAIPVWAAQKTTTLSPVIVVDQYTGFDINEDTFDGVHPDESGELKMAQKWYDTIITQIDLGVDAPSNLQATAVSAEEVQLSWDDNASGERQEDNYVVLRKPYSGSDNWQEIAELPADTISYTDTDHLQGFVQYIYRVGACKSNN